MTIQELENIVEQQISKKFDALIESIDLASGQMLYQTSFEKQEMNSLMGDMSLPHTVFRKFLKQVLPLTLRNIGFEGDIVAVGKDKDGDYFATPRTSLTLMQGLNVSGSFSSKDDLASVHNDSLDKKLVYIEADKTFYEAKMDAHTVDLELLVGEDIIIIGEYTLRKIITLSEVPVEWCVKISDRCYSVENGELVGMYTDKEVKELFANLEARVASLESEKQV